MKPVRCSKCKFFYDEDKYSSCPHCSDGAETEHAAPAAPAAPAPAEHREKSGFSFKPRKKEKPAHNNAAPEAPRAEAAPSPERDIFSNTGAAERAHAAPEAPAPAAPAAPSPAKSPLKSAIQSADSMPKTVAYYNLPSDSEPVVGWLVCIKGDYLGESFNLKSGRNNIGRAGNMDIVLAKDGRVSRDRHAAVVYEPNKREFLVQSGESSGLTYLNGELLMGFKPFVQDDKLTVGGCEFLFKPLCGADFSWDQYIK